MIDTHATYTPKHAEAAMETLLVLATGDFWVELMTYLSGEEEYSSQRIVTVIYFIAFQAICQVLLCVLFSYVFERHSEIDALHIFTQLSLLLRYAYMVGASAPAQV